MSKRSELSQYVHTLEICVDHLLPMDDIDDIAPPSLPGETLVERLVPAGAIPDDKMLPIPYCNRDPARYLQYLGDQERLIQNEYAIICLKQALGWLTQCKRIVISDRGRPWGLGQMVRTLGMFPQRSITFKSQKSVEFVRHALHAILAAVTASELRIEELAINIGVNMRNANRVSPQMLPGPESTALAKFPISSLHHLRITLDPSIPEPSSSIPWSHNLAEFLALFPRLSQLNLGFHKHDTNGRFSQVSSLLYFPSMEILTLSGITCTGGTLLHFLLRHKKTLRKVNLDRINLTDDDDTWHTLIESVRDDMNITHFSMSLCCRKYRAVLEKTAEAASKDSLSEIMKILTLQSYDVKFALLSIGVYPDWV